MGLVSVLKNVSFVIDPGQKVALLGTSGAGKSTLMKLLLRYQDPCKGLIKIDGKDLKMINLGSWLDLVGYISQEAQVLRGTIRDNLLYGNNNGGISDAGLLNVMRDLKIDFGSRLLNGLDTVVGDRGIRLSGGQNQRLMIGAAVCKKPKFMVIDEATSSLDASTEKSVQQGIQSVLSRDIGALIVTHRLNTVRDFCDKFVFLHNDKGSGSCVQAIAGSFEELARKSLEFKKLAKDQGILL